ncbi:MAG: dihydroorotase, partial [Planktomarina temperata]|nr:dihydroorotase [Planktomarina temperata]
ITLTKGDPVQFATHFDTGAGPVTLFNPGFDLHWTVTS